METDVLTSSVASCSRASPEVGDPATAEPANPNSDPVIETRLIPPPCWQPLASTPMAFSK